MRSSIKLPTLSIPCNQRTELYAFIATLSHALTDLVGHQSEEYQRLWLRQVSELVDIAESDATREAPTKRTFMATARKNGDSKLLPFGAR